MSTVGKLCCDIACSQALHRRWKKCKPARGLSVTRNAGLWKRVLRMYMYGDHFMDLAARARHSADAVIRELLGSVPLNSVADFGCARGTWLAAWRRHGVLDTAGLDGPYVRSSDLEIPLESFHACDLTMPIDLARRFALVQSLEVAEHLPPKAARSFVGSLTRHADIVLFSALSARTGW